MRKNPFNSHVLPLLSALLGCVLIGRHYGCASSNCYTARTLEKGRGAFSPGLDYIAIFNKKKIEITREPPAVPALGVHYGLTNYWELGLRGFFPYTLEAEARCQLTPREWRFGDLSANLHVATLKIKEPFYWKGGFTIGKKFGLFEPVVGYYLIGLLNNEYNFSRVRVLNCGLGIHLKNGALLIPEINWYHGNGDLEDGLDLFSLGVRVPIEKKPKNTATNYTR